MVKPSPSSFHSELKINNHTNVRVALKLAIK
jgi:hypothetical protein